MVKIGPKIKNFIFQVGEEVGGQEGDLHFYILISIIIDKHIKMFPYKFQKNRTIKNNFTILSRQTVGRGPTILNFIIGKHLKMLCFKFQQYRTMNEEFNFWEGRIEDPISKFQS